jgi:predicted PurR-regulated permease PerM
LHPLLVMLALLAGAQFGLGGMIVAVPVAAMARVAVKELWWDALAARQAGPGRTRKEARTSSGA